MVKHDQQIVLTYLVEKIKNLSLNESITLLDISIQNLKRLPGKIFQNVSIEGLVISTGGLEYIHDKAFFGLEKHLTALGLPANRLKSIPTQSLNILKTLTRLDMSSNLITSIHSLPSLPDLEYLDMSRNNITTLAAGVTQSLPHLKTLLLAENMMKSSSLSNDNLQHLSYLHTLDIAQNKMTGYLAPSTIQRFPTNIKTLDMSYNHLQGIRGSTFRSLSALLKLNLQGNLIEEIEDSLS